MGHLGTRGNSAGLAAREVQHGLSMALRACAGHLKTHMTSLTAEVSKLYQHTPIQQVTGILSQLQQHLE